MKNYIIVFTVLAFLVISCNKTRTCSCTVTTNGTTTTHTQTAGFPPILASTDTTTYQPLYSQNTTKKTYNKVSKSDMRTNCFAKSEESLNQTTTNNSPGVFTITTTDNGTKTYDCKID